MAVILSVLFAAGIFIDQWTKYLALHILKGSNGFIAADNFLRLTYVENRGAAFGVFSDMRIFLIIMTVLALIIIIYLLLSRKISGKLGQCALTLIACGAVGNLIDRIRLGYVIDMIDFMFVNFAVFNIADCFVTIGTILLAVYLIFFYDREKREEKNE